MLNHDEFPYNIFNTHNSFSREQALDEVITNMKKSKLYEPLGYYFDGSGCSCCLSEYFYLVYKQHVPRECRYRMCFYDGDINHTKTCPVIRCNCFVYFIWKNINPCSHSFKDKDELESFLQNFISFQENDDWKKDYYDFFVQEQENEEIRKYNKEDEEDEDEDEDMLDKDKYSYYLKNFSFYFPPSPRPS